MLWTCSNGRLEVPDRAGSEDVALQSLRGNNVSLVVLIRSDVVAM